MTPEERASIEAAGHLVVDDPDEWLFRDEIQAKLVGLSRAIGGEVKRRRSQAGMTQEALATQIGSSRTRIGKIEATSAGIGLDLAFRAYFALGGTIKDLAQVG